MKQVYLDPLLQHAEFDFLGNTFDEQAAAAVSLFSRERMQ